MGRVAPEPGLLQVTEAQVCVRFCALMEKSVCVVNESEETV